MSERSAPGTAPRGDYETGGAGGEASGSELDSTGTSGSGLGSTGTSGSGLDTGDPSEIVPPSPLPTDERTNSPLDELDPETGVETGIDSGSATGG